ncbi:MAG TPA: GTP-binding protein [Gemmatimonadaceae bacterium]|jgi:bifunctional enzyme CysN/CysC|nr:GTP-binding protein [Gemmatimonadaceae bacterium]
MSAAPGSAPATSRHVRLDEEGLPFDDGTTPNAFQGIADPDEVEARMGIVIVGHVDHGKSTIIGRLLADTGTLPEGRLEQIKDLCARTAKPFEYAFLLDALKDERAQGITIDAARVFFRTPKRRYLILDAPGHVEFLKNMVTGAARAEAALLVLDAGEGIQENTRRHAYLLSLLGVRQIAVVVNKMDLVGGRQDAFDAFANDLTAFLATIGLEPAAIIPVIGRDGDNLAMRSTTMSWYTGPTVLETLDGFQSAGEAVDGPFRMAVQSVYKFTNDGDDRRIVAGTVDSGRIRVGDEVVFHPSGKRTRVKSLEAFNRVAPTVVGAGESAGFTLAQQIYVTRGELATLAHEPQPIAATRIRASVFWLGVRPLEVGRPYTLKLGTARVSAQLESIERVLDASTLESVTGRTSVLRNEVADCVLKLRHPIAFDRASDLAATSRFVLVDNFNISGGGVVREALTAGEVHASRARAGTSVALRPGVLWLTGERGSGKTTLARWLAGAAERAGTRVELLDDDSVGELFPAGGSRAEQDLRVRRLAWLASRLEAHGAVVIVAVGSPDEDTRRYARGLSKDFVEIHVSAEPDVLRQRRAARAEPEHYESPVQPELRLDTGRLTVDDAGAEVLAWLEEWSSNS